MKYILVFFAAAAALLTALFSSVATSAAREAINLCVTVLAPSLFPFFVCANLLVSLGAANLMSNCLGKIMKPVFKVSSAGAMPLILGLISGYPCGAMVTCKMYERGNFSKNEAERLLAFTNNAGPLFIISSLGASLLGSSAIGALIYVSHIAGALICGVALSFFGEAGGKDKKKYVTVSGGALEAVPDAAKSIITLCGYVVFFSVLLSLMRKLQITALISNILCFFGTERSCAEMISGGVLEMTSGIFMSGCRNIPCITALVSFGGVSVLLQTFSFAKKNGLSLKYYITGKVLCGGFSAAVSALLLHFFPLSAQTFAPAAVYEQSPYMYFAAALLCAFPLIFMLFPSRR